MHEFWTILDQNDREICLQSSTQRLFDLIVEFNFLTKNFKKRAKNSKFFNRNQKEYLPYIIVLKKKCLKMTSFIDLFNYLFTKYNLLWLQSEFIIWQINRANIV